mgnify:CR=1 FL=1
MTTQKLTAKKRGDKVDKWCLEITTDLKHDGVFKIMTCQY